MTSYVVDFDINNNTIIINGTSYFNITTIRSILDGITKLDYANMVVQQQILNYLDSIKDGTNSVTLQQLDMYPLRTLDGIEPSYPTDLHTYEKNIRNAYSSYISNITWTKVKKRSPLNPPLQINNIFRDCGIGADVFIADGFELYSNFATYIDPATRSTPTTVWPVTGQSIEFTNNAMTIFGFDNSSIKSITKNKESFDYNIKTNGIEFSYKGTGTDNNLNYFAGNTNKNKILKESSASINQKKALISLKEWGDKMQVVMLLIWKLVNKNQPYTMITCDKVVYTLCMLLDVKCIFTGEIITGGVKQYSIEIFEPSLNPKLDTIKRYNNKKLELIKYNESIIACINLLRLNPMQPIYVDGVSDPFIFRSNFYENIYNDMLSIQTRLTALPLKNMDTQLSISDIELEIKNLKAVYMLIPFIRKIHGKIKILRGNRYTVTELKKPSFDNTYNTTFDKTSFFDIAKKYYMNTVNTIISTNRTQPLSGGTKATTLTNKTNKTIKTATPSISKYTPNIPSRRESMPDISIVINSDVFDDSDFYYDPISYQYYENVPVEVEQNPADQLVTHITTDKHANLNEELYSQVLDILNTKNYSKYMDSVYTMVLVWSEILSGVPLNLDKTQSTGLNNMINHIITMDLDLPQPSLYPIQATPIRADTFNTNQFIPVNVGGNRKTKYNKNMRRNSIRTRKAKIRSA